VNAVFSFVFRPRWIVNMEDDYDFGCKIWGVTFFYYKDSTPLFCMHSVVHREVETKEFGHTISPWRIIQQQVRKEQSCRS